MILAWIKLLRPRQWVKNALVLAPLFFANQFMAVAAWQQALLAVGFFILLSCLVYIINDLRDAKEDRLHPKKRKRPLAAGTISPSAALVFAAILALAVYVLSLELPAACRILGLVYLVWNGAYTLGLKRIAILDVFCVAGCYVMRVLMGAYALGVAASPWIILATFLLALFLAFGKRYHEMGFPEYVATKKNLQHYSRELLDRLMMICGSSALLVYAIYAAEIAQRIGRAEMVYTVVFVAFGLFRYLQSVLVYQRGGEPEAVLFKDPFQLANMALWLICTMAVMFY
jgi:4-hydroxybenzoate polyprenyltransferase